MQDAVVLAAARFAQRDEARQARIGGSIHGIDQHRHAIREIEPTADDQAQTGGAGCFQRPDDPSQRIAIDDAECFDAELFRRLEQFLCRGGAAQKGKVGRDLELGVAHAKIPWQNQ